MERDTALLKIKKCLALAGSSNPNEAAAAMRQAQKLMAMFGLNETDISLAEVVESAARARMTSLVNWEVIMSRIVADAFGCYVYGVSNAPFTTQISLGGVSEAMCLSVLGPVLKSQPMPTMCSVANVPKTGATTLPSNPRPANQQLKPHEAICMPKAGVLVFVRS